jgi:hypothetical protein
MQQVSKGEKSKHVMIQDSLEEYKAFFITAQRQFNDILSVSDNVLRTSILSN